LQLELFMPIDLQVSTASTGHDIISHGLAFAREQLDDDGIVSHNRLQFLAGASFAAQRHVDGLLILAMQGLPRMYRSGSFAHTLRAVKVQSRWTERLEGDNLRYASMVALGLSCTEEAAQRQILKGDNAADLALSAARRAETAADPGAVALAAWAAAEVAQVHAAALFRRLAERLASDAAIATVDCAWALTAALAARRLGDTADVMSLARKRLLSARSASGIFPHLLPASAAGRMRAHIGSFADQVYPIQALSRLYAASGDADALSMAEACAARICTEQGADGQWWWHYDTRNGGVPEGYPVYSVHQHAMAPMALHELREAGGRDHLQAIIKGLRWLNHHPEVVATLVSPEKGVIWRKVARREPKKAARALAALTTSISPRLRIPGLDVLFPPNRVDYECRPYELGWLLYAWLADGVVAKQAAAPGSKPVNFSGEV
jgi:hypothetical protein